MAQEKLDQNATNTAWKDVSSTHIDKIKPYLNIVMNTPEKFLIDSHNDQSSTIVSNSITDIETQELEYIIKTYFSGTYKSFTEDLKLISTKDKSKKKKHSKKKQGLTKDDIIKKNLDRQFKLNKFSFYICNKLLQYNTNQDSVCDLINICKDLYKYKLINTANYLLKKYCPNKENDLDQILQNLHLWKKQQSDTKFELTKCQKSIIKFILHYCKNPFKSSTLLEMSNTGSGKTVGLIMAIGLLWKNILYNHCVSHSFITRRTRTHSVKFPTKIIIAILPSSVLSFVQAALTSMKVPWAHVTPTSTAILDEFNPNAAINYGNVSRKVFTHFCEGGSTAPVVYITTETPTIENSIFNCVKAAYKIVFSNILKYIPSHNLNMTEYISYDSSNNKLVKGKHGTQYCLFDPSTISTFIGDDMETIHNFKTIKETLSPNMLGLITTATPGGLTRALLSGSFKDKLPANTVIPPPQDEVRNTGGVQLLGKHGPINVLQHAYLHLFKSIHKDDPHFNYKWKLVFESFIHGIFERKYIVPHLYLICSQLSHKYKKKLLNRKTFFEDNLELNIDSITCHILQQMSNMVKKTELIEIIMKIPITNNPLYTMSELQNQIIHTTNRGILLCSPNFGGECSLDNELIQSLSGDETIVYNELIKYKSLYNKYKEHVSKVESQFNRGDSIDGASKDEMDRMSQEQVQSVPEPIFSQRYQIFSKDHLTNLKCDNPTIYSTKLPIDTSQIITALETKDTRLAQGILSIDPTNPKKLDNALKKYTNGTPDNIRGIQFKTDAFNTRQLVLGANPPSKLNIVIANYDLIVNNEYTTICTNNNQCKFPTISVTNLLIQICGRIGRGINAEAHNYIFTTSSVANILLTTTPKVMLFNEFANKCNTLNKIQARVRGYLIRK